MSSLLHPCRWQSEPPPPPPPPYPPLPHGFGLAFLRFPIYYCIYLCCVTNVNIGHGHPACDARSPCPLCSPVKTRYHAIPRHPIIAFRAAVLQSRVSSERLSRDPSKARFPFITIQSSASPVPSWPCLDSTRLGNGLSSLSLRARGSLRRGGTVLRVDVSTRSNFTVQQVKLVVVRWVRLHTTAGGYESSFCLFVCLADADTARSRKSEGSVGWAQHVE